MNDDLVACPECDALYRRIAINRGEKACCIRCGAVLRRKPILSLQQMLALILAALITLIIANVFPIVVLSVQGVTSSATLLGSVATLWTEGREIVAALVFFTTFLVPLTDLATLGLLVLCALNRQRPGYYNPLLRALLAARPWGMIEILMLGVLVSLVKLSSMASVIPGAALWAFAALTVMLMVILSWDPQVLWEEEPDE